MALWTFVGREEELSRLARILVDDTARGVVLAGPAGVGKTRLALQLLERAAGEGFATERVVAANTKSELPFGAVAMLLPDAQLWSAAAEPAELARRLASSIAERAEDRRLALLVDDAHLLDEGSAMLVHQLALRNAAFVIATVRTGEPAPGPVVALWKEDLAERLDLEPISDAAVEQVVTGFLGGPVAGAVVATLVRRSRGNMLFVRELLQGALAEEALRSEGGIWHLVGELHPSERLVELIEARLADVDPQERAVLEVLAVGEPLSEDELNAFGTDEVALERLEEIGLISTSLVEGRLSTSLAHPLYGEALRAGISARRERRLTNRLAEIVEETGSRHPDDLLRVGNWRLRGGGGRPDLLLAAAQIAAERLAYPLAERLSQAAVEAGAGFDAQMLRAELTAIQGDRGGAEAQFAELWDLAGDNAQKTHVCMARSENALLRGRLDQAIQVCDEALAVVTEQAKRDAIAARRSWAVLCSEGPRRGLEATSLVGPEPEAGARRAASTTRAMALARVGRTSEAFEAAAEMVRDAPDEFHQFSLVALHDFYRCEALGAAGRIFEMEELAAAAYDRQLQMGSVRSEAHAALMKAMALAERGQVRSAARFAQESCSLLAVTAEPLVLSQALLCRVYTCALANQPGEAAEAWARFEALDLRGVWHFGGRSHARAWLAVANGDLPLAHRAFEEEATASEQCGDLSRMGAALHGLVRIGHPQAAAERLRALVSQMEGDLAPTRADHAEALAGRDAHRLEGVSMSFEALGADLLAAEVSADAAVLWRRAGETRKATAAEHRAADLLERCEGAATPATSSVETRARLTPAERETAMLASQGRSNKEIATELCMSIRTVESRLQHVYTKLGISSRSDLRARLSQMSPSLPKGRSPAQ